MHISVYAHSYSHGTFEIPIIELSRMCCTGSGTTFLFHISVFTEVHGVCSVRVDLNIRQTEEDLVQGSQNIFQGQNVSKSSSLQASFYNSSVEALSSGSMVSI